MALTPTFSSTLDTRSNGWGGFTLRQIIRASLLSLSGNSLTVRIQAASSSVVTISECWVGHAPTNGSLNADFDGTPVQLTFGGSNSVTTAAGGMVESDAKAFNLDETRDFIVSMYFASGGGSRDLGAKLTLSGARGKFFNGNRAGTTGAITSGWSTVGHDLAAVSAIYVDNTPADALTSVTPDEGPEAGGTSVTLAGVGFTSATGVTFGGNNATNVVVVSGTEITCDTPAGVAGLVNVVVVRPTTNLTLTNGFEYVEVPPEDTMRVTQAPVLVINKPNQAARITQAPLLAVSLPNQGIRLSQAPILVPWAPPPLPAAKPILPEMPVTELWEWRTVINIAEDSTEQRAALRALPRVHQTFVALIGDDAERRAVYEFIMRNLAGRFTYPLYTHSTKLVAAAAAGDTKLYFDPAATDMRANEGIVLFDPHTQTQLLSTVATVDTDGATLAIELPTDVGAYWYVSPAPEFRLRGRAGFSMRAIDGDVSLQLEGTKVRSVLRPNQAADLLTTLDGLLVLDKRPLADGSVDEEFNQNVEWLDNDINTPTPRTNWYAPLATGRRTYLAHRPSDLDYWRAVGNYLKGRLNPFLLPTFRADIALYETPALGATTIVSSSVWFNEFWRTTAYKYVRIQSTAGVIYRRILDVSLNYDENGTAISVNIKLNSSIGGAVGANENMVISFMNTCRLDSDTIQLEHDAVDTRITLETRVVVE